MNIATDTPETQSAASGSSHQVAGPAPQIRFFASLKVLMLATHDRLKRALEEEEQKLQQAQQQAVLAKAEFFAD